MRRNIFKILFLFLTINCFSKTKYVATTGSNGNVGSLASPWATLTYAATTASGIVAGDTVFIKAGNYGNEIITFEQSGTFVNTIVFQGYKTTPGDAPPIGVDKADPFASLVTTDMPTYTGTSRSSGAVFMDLEDVSFIEIRNIQAQSYSYGLISGKSTNTGNHHFYNCNFISLGNISSGYSGIGMRIGSLSVKFSDYNILEKCLVANACAEGISIYGDHNIIKYCECWSNEESGTSPMDYYMIVAGFYNVFDHCWIDRPPGLTTGGYHGYTIKSNAEEVVDQGLSEPVIDPEFNQFLYCTAINSPESFSVRHRGVQHNLFYKCEAYGTHTGAPGSSAGEGIGIVIRDGASNNLFEACLFKDCATAIKFLDTVEDGDTGGSPPGHPGHGNRIIACLSDNCYSAIEFSNTGIASDAGDNLIASCTFYRPRYCIRASRSCDSIKYVGNIFYGCASTNPNTGVTQGFIYDNGFGSDVLANGTYTYFKDCDYYSIQTGMPTNFVTNTVGGISSDPLFVSSGSHNFRLTSSSPCISAGTHIETSATEFPYCQFDIPGRNMNFLKDISRLNWRILPHVTRDFDGLISGGTFDLGCYKYY